MDSGEHMCNPRKPLEVAARTEVSYPITKYLKLPFQFDKEKLKHDLSLIPENSWVAHFNQSGYEGQWKALPLYTPGGDEKTITVPVNDVPIMATSLMEPCHYFREVIEQFKCSLLSVRLLRLGAGGMIHPHTDHRLGYEDGCFRLHIPIITSEEVKFVLDDQPVRMLEGECWYTNVNFSHSVVNNGNTDRVHIVIDGKRNKWSDALFFSLAPEESFEVASVQNYSEETKKRMIEELEHVNGAAAKKLIIQLKEDISGNF